MSSSSISGTGRRPGVLINFDTRYAPLHRLSNFDFSGARRPEFELLLTGAKYIKDVITRIEHSSVACIVLWVTERNIVRDGLFSSSDMPLVVVRVIDDFQAGDLNSLLEGDIAKSLSLASNGVKLASALEDKEIQIALEKAKSANQHLTVVQYLVNDMMRHAENGKTTMVVGNLFHSNQRFSVMERMIAPTKSTGGDLSRYLPPDIRHAELKALSLDIVPVSSTLPQDGRCLHMWTVHLADVGGVVDLLDQVHRSKMSFVYLLIISPVKLSELRQFDRLAIQQIEAVPHVHREVRFVQLIDPDQAKIDCRDAYRCAVANARVEIEARVSFGVYQPTSLNPAQLDSMIDQLTLQIKQDQQRQ